MRVYIPYWALGGVRVLEWAAGLGGQPILHATVQVHHSYWDKWQMDNNTRRFLTQIFRSFDAYKWTDVSGLEAAWDGAARHAFKNNNGEPWFLWPADRIPLHKGWLEQIRDAYWTRRTLGSIGLGEVDRQQGAGVYSPTAWPIVSLVGRDPKMDECPDI